jgi:nucleotide-binding universal stress UspA family protein
MPLFRTILVAADFSEYSREAFRMACSLARPDETQITVLHAVEPPMISELDVPLPPTAGDRAHHEALGGRLRESYAPDRPLQVEYRTRDGFAAEGILRVGDEIDADLIVLGTHGRTGVGRLLAGSVAEAVLRRAHCPVLALRSPPHLAAMPEARELELPSPGEKPGTEAPSASSAPQGREFAMRPIKTILHPTDFSGRSEAAFRVAGSLAREHGARLIVLHAAPMATVYGGTFPGVPTDPTVYQHALEERLRQIRIPAPEAEVEPRPKGAGPAREERPQGRGTSRSEVLVEHRLREGDAAVEVLQVADDVGADLIVMGTHGRTGLDRVMMGSVAEAILRGSRCPVLVVKGQIPTTEAVDSIAVPVDASD